MTPDEWNKKHRREPIDTREIAPVNCPRCNGRMYFPDNDHTANDRVVRCASRSVCCQATIANPAYAAETL